MEPSTAVLLTTGATAAGILALAWWSLREPPATRVVEGKVYSTHEATPIWCGRGGATLYRTPRGRFFVNRHGHITAVGPLGARVFLEQNAATPPAFRAAGLDLVDA